jgi:hypothetical protein
MLSWRLKIGVGGRILGRITFRIGEIEVGINRFLTGKTEPDQGEAGGDDSIFVGSILIGKHLMEILEKRRESSWNSAIGVNSRKWIKTKMDFVLGNLFMVQKSEISLV